eukprot:795143-Rhodomonas_salina.1
MKQLAKWPRDANTLPVLDQPTRLIWRQAKGFSHFRFPTRVPPTKSSSAPTPSAVLHPERRNEERVATAQPEPLFPPPIQHTTQCPEPQPGRRPRAGPTRRRERSARRGAGSTSRSSARHSSVSVQSFFVMQSCIM